MSRSITLRFAVAALALFGSMYIAAQQKPAGPAGRSLQIAHVRVLRELGRAHAQERVHRPHDRPQRHDARSRNRAACRTDVQSCHTAVVNGYVVEGHVPAADVHRLLKEKPAIAGIAVGGMPIGSPGMESPGMKAAALQRDVVRQERRHARVRETLMNGSMGAAGFLVPRCDRSSARV